MLPLIRTLRCEASLRRRPIHHIVRISFDLYYFLVVILSHIVRLTPTPLLQVFNLLEVIRIYVVFDCRHKWGQVVKHSCLRYHLLREVDVDNA